MEGHCKLGFKTYDKAVAEYQHFWKDNFNETLMHCVCKDGFFGPRYVSGSADILVSLYIYIPTLSFLNHDCFTQMRSCQYSL